MQVRRPLIQLFETLGCIYDICWPATGRTSDLPGLHVVDDVGSAIEEAVETDIVPHQSRLQGASTLAHHSVVATEALIMPRSITIPLAFGVTQLRSRGRGVRGVRYSDWREGGLYALHAHVIQQQLVSGRGAAAPWQDSGRS